MDATFLSRYRSIRENLRERHRDIVVVLAPPRTSSTALVRVFWRHPGVGYYNNEPFDRSYHHHAPLVTVLDHLDRSTVAVPDEPRGDALVIKDMTFQAGRHFRLLADLVTAPLVFVLRDPRLSISSRMRMVAADGGVPTYPQRESGWEVLFEQVQACRVEGRSYVLIDAGDFRAAPEAVFSRLFVALGMTFERSQLQWSPAPDVRLGNLDGAQHNWYRRVLNSRGLQPTTEKVPPLETFPVRGGFRAHVERSVQLYRLLRRDPRLLTPTCPTSVLANSRDRALTGAQR